MLIKIFQPEIEANLKGVKLGRKDVIISSRQFQSISDICMAHTQEPGPQACLLNISPQNKQVF